jgi:uncharacterized protein
MDYLDQNPDEQHNANDQQLAMWGHLIGLLSCMSGFFGLIGTVIFYVVNQNKSPFIKQHAANALNFQITYFISSVLIGLLMVGALFGSLFSAQTTHSADNATGIIAAFSSIGISALVLFTLFIINVVCCIKAAITANKGEIWHNPMAITLIR